MPHAPRTDKPYGPVRGTPLWPIRAAPHVHRDNHATRRDDGWGACSTARFLGWRWKSALALTGPPPLTRILLGRGRTERGRGLEHDSAAGEPPSPNPPSTGSGQALPPPPHEHRRKRKGAFVTFSQSSSAATEARPPFESPESHVPSPEFEIGAARGDARPPASSALRTRTRTGRRSLGRGCRCRTRSGSGTP